MKTRLAITALLAAIAAAPACGDLKKNVVSVEVVAYGPDGTLVLFTTAAIYVYDETLEMEQRRIVLLDAPDSPGDHRYSLAADGTVAAVSTAPNPPGHNSRIALYRIADGQLLNTFEIDDAAPPGQGHQLLDLALSPHGDLVYAFSENGATPVRAAVYDAVTGAPLWIGDPFMRLPAWAPDGATLFTVSSGNIDEQRLQAFDARTGELRWSTATAPFSPSGLAVTADGASLAAVSYVTTSTDCVELGDCPPGYPFWSTADGALAQYLLPVRGTELYGTNPNGWPAFTCSTTDNVCAAGLIDFGADPDRPIVRVYRTDGTEPPLLSTSTSDVTGSMALSPGARFIAVAPDSSFLGGVSVFRIEDGALISSRTFTVDTF